MLFGHEGQHLNDYINDVKKAIELGVPHITTYPFFDKKHNSETYDKQKQMYETGQDQLKSNGYIQYSMVDFHKKDKKKSNYSTILLLFIRSSNGILKK
ncbi:MAG: hypothetical protein KAX49_11235 [Halanaerobiales bacterium]|nr:hypothetical protein [Halanaerobiales bacterium]